MHEANDFLICRPLPEMRASSAASQSKNSHPSIVPDGVSHRVDKEGVEAERRCKIIDHCCELGSVALPLKVAADGNEPHNPRVVAAIVEPGRADGLIVEF